jgi:hypothetical protein
MHVLGVALMEAFSMTFRILPFYLPLFVDEDFPFYYFFGFFYGLIDVVCLVRLYFLTDYVPFLSSFLSRSNGFTQLGGVEEFAVESSVFSSLRKLFPLLTLVTSFLLDFYLLCLFFISDDVLSTSTEPYFLLHCEGFSF